MSKCYLQFILPQDQPERKYAAHSEHLINTDVHERYTLL